MNPAVNPKTTNSPFPFPFNRSYPPPGSPGREDGFFTYRMAAPTVLSFCLAEEDLVLLVAIPFLILSTGSLDVRFGVRLEEFFGALLPRLFGFRPCNVPIRPAFLGNGTQVLAKLFQRRPAKERVAIVNLVNDKTGLEHNHVRNHRIVARIGVLRDVEIFLDRARGIGEERPVGTDSDVINIRLGDVAGADCDQPAIPNLEFAMKLNNTFMLSAVL